MLPVSRVIGHKEYGNTAPGGWPGRKTDPVYSMNARRAAVAGFTPRNKEDDMPTVDELLNGEIEFRRPDNGELVKASLASWIANTNYAVGKVPGQVWTETVERYAADGKTIVKVPVLQELADTKTGIATLLGRIAGLETALEKVSKGESYTLEEIGAEVEAATQRALLAGTVEVKVSVAGHGTQLDGQVVS